jgi:hypothetical protein
LALKSGIIPKVIGWILMLSGIAYLFESYANILLPNYIEIAPTIQNFVVLPEFLGELLLILWMIIKETKINRNA